jgi:hypothetical protein
MYSTMLMTMTDASMGFPDEVGVNPP